MLEKTIIGDRIQSLRKNMDLSQADLADRLMISTQAVSKWGTGNALPDVEMLLRLSWLFHISINELLEGEEYIQPMLGVDRGLQRIAPRLRCPDCHKPLSPEEGYRTFVCPDGHQFVVDEDVLYFNTREIPGEQWSLIYRNYDHYLTEQRHVGAEEYQRGEVPGRELFWREVEARKPKVILDMACGTGNGIKHIIQRINWPVTIIMLDLSHRILKWNHQFYNTEWKNPYVDLVCLAADGSNVPLMDESVDMVFSNGGFESMQLKMLDGMREATRILKPDGFALYNISAIESHDDPDTQKWMRLMPGNPEHKKEVFMTPQEWAKRNETFGLTRNKAIWEYGELPAPEGEEFPYENQVLRWMASYIMVSEK